MNDHKDVIHLLSMHIKDFKKGYGEGFTLEQHALDGVEEFYRQADFYGGNAQITAEFLAELACCLGELGEALRARDGGDVFDNCFQLVEIICVLLRETFLVTGQASPVAMRLFDFFENSGQWTPADDTLVAELYYITLPAAYAA